MAKVKRDDIRQREIAKKEPQSKPKNFRFVVKVLFGWMPWCYGVVMLLSLAITHWLNFYDTISPRVTVEAKADQASLHNVEFTFTNEGTFALQNVTLDTVLVWYEGEDSSRMIPHAQDEHSEQEWVAFQDRYSYLGEIPPHGGTATANLIDGFRQETEKHGVKRLGICQELSYQMFPLDWLSKWLPINKLRWDVGYWVDKPAGVHNWRQGSCAALRKNMPDRRHYGAP
jgi:hypothetical protein